MLLKAFTLEKISAKQMSDLLSHYEKAARRKVLTRSLKGRVLLGLEGLRKRDWSVLYLIALPGDVLIVMSRRSAQFVAKRQAAGNLALEKQLCSKWTCVLILFLVAVALPVVNSTGATPFIEKFIVSGSFFALGVSVLTVILGER
jgi:hypothetical protein